MLQAVTAGFLLAEEENGIGRTPGSSGQGWEDVGFVCLSIQTKYLLKFKHLLAWVTACY